ncbi:MAG: hypothetical protein QOH35_4734 [Acidobacteriaceae bacterium]|jgi:hypothetical protein|nr:hypothetical protein [Acidobacteriaceae bacterium]
MTDMGYSPAPLSEKEEVLASRVRLRSAEFHLARPCSKLTRKTLRQLIRWEKDYLARHDPQSPKPTMLRIEHAFIEHTHQKRSWWETPCGLVFVFSLPFILRLLRHSHPVVGCLLLLVGLYVTSRGSSQ